MKCWSTSYNSDLFNLDELADLFNWDDIFFEDFGGAERLLAALEAWAWAFDESPSAGCAFLEFRWDELLAWNFAADTSDADDAVGCDCGAGLSFSADFWIF